MYNVKNDVYVTNFIIIISFILFINDLSTDIYPRIIDFDKIQKFKCLVILFFHHFLSALITFGFLYSDKRKLALILAINGSIFLHWKTNDGMCTLTNYINSECNFKDDQLFNDIWMISGLKSPENQKILFSIQFIIFTIIFAKLLK